MERLFRSRFTLERLKSDEEREYADIDNFRKKVKAAMVKIRTVYPGLRLGRRPGGIEVLPASLPAIEPKQLPPY